MTDWISRCVSIDVETAGPVPGGYSLLSIGACLLTRTTTTFYAELSPDRAGVDDDALAISGLSMSVLREEGTSPREAMARFAEWLDAHVPGTPIFVAFNAAFDWMFINEYFHRYLGFNPFGHSALDIKAFALGAIGIAWPESGIAKVSGLIGKPVELAHNALKDAQDQAVLFLALWERIFA